MMKGYADEHQKGRSEDEEQKALDEAIREGAEARRTLETLYGVDVSETLDYVRRLPESPEGSRDASAVESPGSGKRRFMPKMYSLGTDGDPLGGFDQQKAVLLGALMSIAGTCGEGMSEDARRLAGIAEAALERYRVFG